MLIMRESYCTYMAKRTNRIRNSNSMGCRNSMGFILPYFICVNSSLDVFPFMLIGNSELIA